MYLILVMNRNNYLYFILSLNPFLKTKNHKITANYTVHAFYSGLFEHTKEVENVCFLIF